MLSVSKIRKILDKIAAEAGIQEINEKVIDGYHHVFYYMLGTKSYFMKFTWYNNSEDLDWRINVADSIKVMSDSEIFTTGNVTIYPRRFDNFAVNVIKNRLNELITDYNKVRKEMKLKEILSARGKYDV